MPDTSRKRGRLCLHWRGVETTSKVNPDTPVGLAGLKQIRTYLRNERPDLPVGAIAGITLERVPDVIAAGADGVALISALFARTI